MRGAPRDGREQPVQHRRPGALQPRDDQRASDRYRRDLRLVGDQRLDAQQAQAKEYETLLERVKAQLAERSQQISARTAEISELPIFQNRLLLRAPRTGTLVREITELEEFREPLAQVLQKAGHPRLQRLLDVEYGLPSYSVPFWRLSYFADWKAGDEIVERGHGRQSVVTRCAATSVRAVPPACGRPHRP